MADAEVLYPQTTATADPLKVRLDNEDVDYGGTMRKRQRVVIPGPKTSAVSRVAHPGNTATVSLLAANAARRGFVVRNESADDLFVKYGAAATSVDYTDLVPPGGTLRERDGSYCGAVTGAWSAATGGAAAQVTELTT